MGMLEGTSTCPRAELPGRVVWGPGRGGQRQTFLGSRDQTLRSHPKQSGLWSRLSTQNRLRSPLRLQGAGAGGSREHSWKGQKRREPVKRRPRTRAPTASTDAGPAVQSHASGLCTCLQRARENPSSPPTVKKAQGTNWVRQGHRLGDVWILGVSSRQKDAAKSVSSHTRVHTNAHGACPCGLQPRRGREVLLLSRVCPSATVSHARTHAHTHALRPPRLLVFLL